MLFRSVNAEAYEAYLKGRYYWNKRSADGLKKSVQYFRQAIEKDPTYAPAYAGLADAYATLAGFNVLPAREVYPLAKAAATKAVELDETLADAHLSLAAVVHGYDWDWALADREFKRAVELGPNSATVHDWYALYLVWSGQLEEALAESKIGRAHV